MKAVGSGRLGLVICACLQPPSINNIEAVPPQARGVLSTIIGTVSLSAAKALPGPKTYENDVHISLRLSISINEQLRRSGVHIIQPVN